MNINNYQNICNFDREGNNKSYKFGQSQVQMQDQFQLKDVSSVCRSIYLEKNKTLSKQTESESKTDHQDSILMMKDNLIDDQQLTVNKYNRKKMQQNQDCKNNTSKKTENFQAEINTNPSNQTLLEQVNDHQYSPQITISNVNNDQILTVRKKSRKKTQYKKENESNEQVNYPQIQVNDRDQETREACNQHDLYYEENQINISHSRSTIDIKEVNQNTQKIIQYDQIYLSQEHQNILQKLNIDKNQFEDIKILLENKKYTIDRYLTKGGQAYVLTGTYTNSLNEKQKCVYKVYKYQDQANIEEEVKILKLLNKSQNTVKLLSFFSNKEKNIQILVMNQCQYSLQDEINILKNNGSNFTFNELCFIISNLIEGVIEFRMYKVIHSDIKPGNILKTFDNKYVYSDFGISCRFQEGTNIEPKGRTDFFCPPEQQYKNYITYQSDVYSLGVTIKLLIKFYQDQIKQSIQKDINYEQQQQQQQQLQCLLNLIEEKMLKHNCTEREECIGLVFQYYEIIGKRNLQMQFYFKQQIRLFPFIQDIENKDSKFMNIILLKYQLLNFQIYVDQYKLSIKMEDFENLKSEEILNQVILHRDINKLKYLRLITIISSLYFKIGQSQKSQLIRKHCEAVLKQIQSENAYITPEIYFQLGQLCLQNRDDNQALLYFQESLKILNLNFFSNHPMIAQNYMKIGYCYLLKFDTNLSLQNYLKSQEIFQHLYQKDIHKDLANIIDHIGFYYGKIGDYKNGLRYAFHALNMRKKLNKNNEIDISFSYSRLAFFFQNIPNYQKALRYQKKCLKLRIKLYDQTSILIAQTYLELGKILQGLNQPKQALKQYLLSIQLAYKSYNNNNYHQAIGVALNLSSQCFQRLGDFNKAEYCQQFSIFVKLQNPQNIYHPYTATSYDFLGNLYLQQGKTYNGINHILFSYIINLNCQDQSIKALSKYKLGKLYLKHGQPQKALKYSSESLKINLQIYNSSVNHIEVAKCLVIFGLSQLQIGKEEEALKNCKKSLEILKILMKKNENDPAMSDCLEGLSECYYKLKDYSKSQYYMQKYILIKQQIYSANHPEIAQSLSKLGYLFECQADYNQSLKYYIQSFQVQKNYESEMSHDLMQLIVKIVICNQLTIR